MARAESREPAGRDTVGYPGARRPGYATIAWILLLLLGALFVFAPLSDLAADARTGLPADHLGTFQSVTGIAWSTAVQSAPGITRYVTLLEVAYAVHETGFLTTLRDQLVGQGAARREVTIEAPQTTSLFARADDSESSL